MQSHAMFSYVMLYYAMFLYVTFNITLSNIYPTQGIFKAGFTTAQNIAIGQMAMQRLRIYTAHFDFTTAKIVINCTLRYALTPHNSIQGMPCRAKYDQLRSNNWSAEHSQKIRKNIIVNIKKYMFKCFKNGLFINLYLLLIKG